MIDIVERLRRDADIDDLFCLTVEDILQAADEIERLRQRESDLCNALDVAEQEAFRQRTEILDLKAAIQIYVQALALLRKEQGDKHGEQA